MPGRSVVSVVLLPCGSRADRGMRIAPLSESRMAGSAPRSTSRRSFRWASARASLASEDGFWRERSFIWTLTLGGVSGFLTALRETPEIACTSAPKKPTGTGTGSVGCCPFLGLLTPSRPYVGTDWAQNPPEMTMRMKERLPCKPAGRGTDRDSARASAAPSEWSSTVALLLATTGITAAVTTYVGTTLV